MLYAGIWFIITIIQILAVHFIAGLPLGYTIADAVIFSLIFAGCAIPLWYPVCYNQKKDISWYAVLFVHGVLIVLLLSIWLGFGYFLMYLFTGGDKIYLYFIKASVWWKVIEGFFLYVVLVLVYDIYIYIEKLNEKVNNEIRLNKLLKDGELNLLKSQINPHFLFNSLNSLHALIIKAPEKAGDMLIALSDYLRYTVLSTRQEYSSLENEIENIERYLSIEKLRFGDKLEYTIDCRPECLHVKIPSMILQPLFENAVKHGVYESLEVVVITAKIKKENHYLLIEIGNGFDPENTSRKKGSGTGLKNIRERLVLSYATDASLLVKSKDKQFVVMLKMPVITEENES